MDQEFIEYTGDIDEEFVEEPMADIDIDSISVDHEMATGEPSNHLFDSADLSTNLTDIKTTKIDLEAISNDYCDYGLMNRLLFIADSCAALRFDALRMLVDYVLKNTQNISMYNSIYQRLDSSRQSGFTDGIEKVPLIDKNWIDETNAKSNARLDSYILEYKRQKDEAIKESIRRAIDDVFQQHIQMGNLNEALKLYGRGMREYCTSPIYLIQMLINWINATIYSDQWSKLSLLLPQAERAIIELMDREPSSPAGAGSSSSLHGKASIQSKTFKELVESSKAKVAAVSGLFKMHEKNYKHAAEKFLSIDIEVLNYPQLISANDIAVYGTLCALATFSRNDIKNRVLGCALRKFLESEPKLVELLQKFYRGQFGACLDILSDYRDQFLLNIYLAPHLNQLYVMIRQAAIIQYFQPYLTVSIGQMSVEFRTSESDMENELICLIEKGQLKARIDSFNKILRAKFSDVSTEITKRSLTLEKDMNRMVRSVLLLAALHNQGTENQR